MAQKKGLIYRWVMGKDDQPDFTEAKLPGTRWQVFKDVIKQRFGALVKINLLMLLFALPLIVWYVLNNMLVNTAINSYLPFGASFGPGYPVINDLDFISNVYRYQNNITFGLIMIPLIVLAGIGLGGGFHVIKLLVWGEGISVAQNFFQGLKRNFLQYLLGSLLIALAIFMVMMNMSLMPIVEMKPFMKVLTTSSVILLLVLTLFFSMYYFTQAETYKLKLWGLIKNSFIFSIGMLFQNIIFMLLSLLPFLLFFISASGILFMIVLVIFIFFGLSYTVLVWTIYTQYVYDKFINDKVEGAIKDKGIYRKIKGQDEMSVRRMKAANVRMVTSIDEGSTFTPLSDNFSRADIMRLAREKKIVETEIQQELEEADKVMEEIMNQPLTDEEYKMYTGVDRDPNELEEYDEYGNERKKKKVKKSRDNQGEEKAPTASDAAAAKPEKLKPEEVPAEDATEDYDEYESVETEQYTEDAPETVAEPVQEIVAEPAPEKQKQESRDAGTENAQKPGGTNKKTTYSTGKLYDNKGRRRK